VKIDPLELAERYRKMTSVEFARVERETLTRVAKRAYEHISSSPVTIDERTAAPQSLSSDVTVGDWASTWVGGHKRIRVYGNIPTMPTSI